MAHCGFYFYFPPLETAQISSKEEWLRGCAVPSVLRAAVGRARWATVLHTHLVFPIPAEPQPPLSTALHLQLAATGLDLGAGLDPGLKYHRYILV